jgi:hypothetical protein
VKVEFHPIADSELRAAASYYEDRVSGLGDEFLADVERGCLRLSEHQARARTEARCGSSTACIETISVRSDLSG